MRKRIPLVLLVVAAAIDSHVVKFSGTDDPIHNTTAPNGALADSG